jgi:hypothetical protein
VARVTLRGYAHDVIVEESLLRMEEQRKGARKREKGCLCMCGYDRDREKLSEVW